MMKTLLVTLVMMVALLSATSCNTVKGLGQDVEDVGDAMSDAMD